MKTEDKKINCFTNVYSRVTGYFSPMSQWNKGKVEEGKERKKFDGAVKDASKEKGKEG
jgi:anaerobic ribonucleoside-triphosphate reductase